MSTLRYTSASGARLEHGHDGDAGIDLPAAEEYAIGPQSWANVPIDIKVELPKGVWAFVVGRSSTFFHKHLLVNSAVIDNGYRGELFVCCYNMTGAWYIVNPGERLAQLIPMLLVPVDLQPVSELEPSARGAAGFGSTG